MAEVIGMTPARIAQEIATYVDETKWDRGNVPASYTLDDLTPGAWGVASGTVSTNLGIPEVATGTVVIAQTRHGHPRTAMFTSSTQTTDYTRVWVNSTNNTGVWGQWKALADHDYVEASKWTRGNVLASHTLDDLTPGAWGVASGTVATNLGIPEVATGTVVIARINYDGGKSATFASSTETTGYPRVWVNSTNNTGVWGQWKELLTPDHLSENEIPKNIAITGAASLDELADGKYQVRAPSEAEAWGLPARQAGWLEKLSFPGAILFRFTTNHVDDSVWPFQVWHRATNGGGEWIMPWVKTSPPEDISGQLADRPTFDWVNQQIASVDTQASFGTDPDGVPYVMIGE